MILDVPSHSRTSVTFAHFFVHLIIVCVEFSSFVTLNHLEICYALAASYRFVLCTDFCLSKAEPNHRYPDHNFCAFLFFLAEAAIARGWFVV